jgi:hypothetical protein
VGSTSVTCTAIDYNNQVTTTSPQQSFSIKDHTPPILSLILHVEGQMISHTDEWDRKFIFNLGSQPYDLPLTPEEALFVTNLSIQHESGNFGDTALFKDLEKAYLCSDMCTAENDLQAHATWHVVSELTTCESMPAHTNWELVDVTKPGTFVIKYTCADQSNNAETACRTIFNEGIDTTTPTATPTSIPTSMPTSSPTASPTYQPCDPDTTHMCDLTSTYCGLYDVGDGSQAVICACNPGYLTNPESETSCIATAAPTAVPTHAPSTSYPTSHPTLEIVIPELTPEQSEKFVAFKLIFMPNVVIYLNDALEMLMAFIRFWAGEKLAEVQNAIDHFVFTMQDYPLGTGNGTALGERRLRGGDSFQDFEEELRPRGNFMGGVRVQSNGRRLFGDTGGAAKAPMGVAQLGENYTEVCPVVDPDDGIDSNWRVPMRLQGNATHRRMKDYAFERCALENNIGCEAVCGQIDNPYRYRHFDKMNVGAMDCEPRSSPNTFGVTVGIMLTAKNDSAARMGTFCLKDTVTHILDSNGGNVPDFCGNICDQVDGECAKKTVEQYFNKLKANMLSGYHAGLECTTSPTASPTALPTQPFKATVPVLNFINQCNGFGPCSMSNDASTSYCVAASLDGMYTDEGAVCSDTLEGDVSNRVTVSEDHVDLSRAGTYRVRYNCTTAGGGIATPIVRSSHSL